MGPTDLEYRHIRLAVSNTDVYITSWWQRTRCNHMHGAPTMIMRRPQLREKRVEATSTANIHMHISLERCNILINSYDKMSELHLHM